jgi:hypothetical protein
MMSSLKFELETGGMIIPTPTQLTPSPLHIPTDDIDVALLLLIFRLHISVSSSLLVTCVEQAK